jgi:hypothetical protein
MLNGEPPLVILGLCSGVVLAILVSLLPATAR